jgi:hypothetical protein
MLRPVQTGPTREGCRQAVGIKPSPLAEVVYRALSANDRLRNPSCRGVSGMICERAHQATIDIWRP